MTDNQPQTFAPTVGRPHLAAMVRRPLFDRAANVFELQFLKGIAEGEIGRHRETVEVAS